MRPRVLLFGALGTLATVLAAVAVFASGVVEAIGPLAGLASALGEVDRRQLLLLASAVVGLFVSVVSWRATASASGEADAFDAATAGPPESVTSGRQRLTAAGIERDIDAAVRGNDGANRHVHDRLGETVARAYARSVGCSVAEARTAVRTGEWTDDRTAAATLADDDGPTHSLWSRLRLWLDPEGERQRRFESAVRAAARLVGDDPAGGER
ncbi:hypothetical protein SAMN05216559_0573 [Halomicrobium zhouii]|uniref:Uncharacterized protein n=1 Tax=Halomicrobium zhouii TaxID=767519 RepID=A0A1I6KCX1_9EURY|nr:hypothetical protein [Halomicrobium zhouii]SFR89072.1 hypothetical protein SAMN05216559_0573 [Halomicrobium zhouii]